MPRPIAKADDILEMWRELDLRPKELDFVFQYCTNGFDEKLARDKAGYSKSIFTKEHVKKAIAIYMNAILAQKKPEVLDKVINVLYKRAFYDPFMFYDTDGQPKFSSLEEIDEEWRVVVDGIEQKYWGKDSETSSVVLKLADRNKAIQELTKILELSKEQIKIEGMNDISRDAGFTFNLNVIDTTTSNALKTEMERIIEED